MITNNLLCRIFANDTQLRCENPASDHIHRKEAANVRALSERVNVSGICSERSSLSLGSGIAGSSSIRDMLHNVGLRPTHQRIVLVHLLLGKGSRRLSAEILYDEARGARFSVSRATVTYTLRHFERIGLLRRVQVCGSRKVWFTLNPLVVVPKGRRRASNRFDAEKLD